MTRKPEWMAMYQELVESHRLESHAMSINHPYEFQMTTCDDEYIDDELEWCLENLEMDAWRYLMSKDDSDGAIFYNGVIFSFTDDADRVLFMLTWGNR